MEGRVEGAIQAAGDRYWKRNRNILAVGFSIIGVLIACMAWLVLNGAQIGLSNEVYLFVFLPAFIAYSMYAQWRYVRKILAFVRALAPRLRDVTFQGRAGIVAMFDNGILLRPLRTGGNGPSGFLFGTFLGQDRNPMFPTKEQVLPWSKSFGRKQKLGTVSRKKGPESGRAQLEAIRQSIGGSAAFSIVEHHAAGSPADPSFYVGVVLVDRKWLSKAAQVSQQIDTIDAFLRQMPVQDFSAPLAPH